MGVSARRAVRIIVAQIMLADRKIVRQSVPDVEM